MTGQQMCRAIAKAIADGDFTIRNSRTGQELTTADEIWNYSPTGELYMVFQWYEQVKALNRARREIKREDI